MSDTKIRHLIIAGCATAGTVALMLAPRIANADRHHRPHCENVEGHLDEDLGGAANCPPEHPGCFIGHIEGHNIHATTQFYGEGSAPPPEKSPDWFSYSGVTTYTMSHGSIVTRETGLASTVAITDAEPDGSGASLSLEVITGVTGDLTGHTRVWVQKSRLPNVPGGWAPVAAFGMTTGRKGEVRSVAISETGRYVVAAGDEGMMMWDLTETAPGAFGSGARVLKPKVLSQKAVYVVTLAPDGKTLAAAQADGVWLWDITTGQKLSDTPLFEGPGGRWW